MLFKIFRKKSKKKTRAEHIESLRKLERSDTFMTSVTFFFSLYYIGEGLPLYAIYWILAAILANIPPRPEPWVYDPEEANEEI